MSTRTLCHKAVLRKSASLQTSFLLNNYPVYYRTGEPNAVWDHFETTPSMSTFTLGLVIADLKQVGSPAVYKDENGNNLGNILIIYVIIIHAT